jgi:hypothetical protein
MNRKNTFLNVLYFSLQYVFLTISLYGDFGSETTQFLLTVLQRGRGWGFLRNDRAENWLNYMISLGHCKKKTIKKAYGKDFAMYRIWDALIFSKDVLGVNVSYGLYNSAG